MRLADIDLLDLDRYVQSPPAAEFELLRREAPVFRHAEPNGPGFWVLSKHADVVACSRDPKTFSSRAELGGTVDLEERERDELWSAVMSNVLFMMDPPQHTRYRLLVAKAFSPKVVAALDQRVRARSAALIDDAVERGSCDFVADVASHLPLAVISDLVGVPRESHGQFIKWMNEMLPGEDPEYQTSDATFEQAMLEVYRFLGDLRDKRRREPSDDLVSALAFAESDGETLTDLEIDSFLVLLISAGSETTRNALAQGMLALLQYPGQWATMRANPDILPTAVEEILRWSSPIMMFRRNVTEDVSVRDVRMRVGDKVGLSYYSANRDEEVFGDPEVFRVDRLPNDHVVFGGGGPHFCVGASLARLELRVFFEELMLRSPQMEIAGEPERLRNRDLNALKYLPMTFTR
jgi:cholest-4-en-3-one 26-monooxygenase